MSLTRVGGRGDQGVDLRGSWTPPAPSPRPMLNVYVQCKAERSRTGPKHLRELEGTLNLSTTPQTPPIGILAATTACTAGLRKHMLMSRLPLAYCCIAPHHRGGHIEQFLWNSVVGAMIGHGVGVTTRYIPPLGTKKKRGRKPKVEVVQVDEEGNELRREAELTVDGQVVEYCHTTPKKKRRKRKTKAVAAEASPVES